MRSKIVWLLAVLLSLPLALLPSEVQASSVFDNTVRLIDNATIRCYNYTNGLLTGDKHDLSMTWSAFVDPTVTSFEGRAVNRSFGSIDPDDVYQAFQDRQSDGKGWSVGVIDEGSSYGNFIRVYVQKNTNTAYFTNLIGSDPDWYVLASDNTYTLNIHCRNDGFLIEAWEGQAIYARSGSTATSIYTMKTDISYPSGYEGALVPQSPPPAKYVAMGDSFSSGEGNPPFEYGTDEDGVNECHRSLNAYPRLLQYDSSLNLGSTAFVACAGATASDITSGDSGDSSDNWGEGPQVNALSASTEVVTITIGGNDIKFGEFASACVSSNCASTSDEYLESWDIMTDSNRSDYLPDSLADVLSGIATGLTTQNTSAKIYVVGYPYVVTEYAWTSTTSSDPWNCLYLSQASAAGTEAIIAKLNEVIEDAVTAFNDSRFEYIDPLATGSPFLGHELCTSGGYFHGIEAAAPPNGQDAYVFHPNENGQNAYEELVTDTIN